MKNDCNVDTKKVYSKVEDFLKDDDFIKYVLDDAPESAFHWDKLLKEHAELLKVFEEAKNVLLVSDEAMEVMTLSEERKLKHRIFTTLEINNMEEMSESDFELRHQTYSYSFGTVSCIMYASCFFVCKCWWQNGQ